MVPIEVYLVPFGLFGLFCYFLGRWSAPVPDGFSIVPDDEFTEFLAYRRGEDLRRVADPSKYHAFRLLEWEYQARIRELETSLTRLGGAADAPAREAPEPRGGGIARWRERRGRAPERS